MRKILNLKFKKSIQLKLNNLFSDEEYHAYTLGEVLGIFAINAVVMTLVIILSTIK
jgi:hypothetical protein